MEINLFQIIRDVFDAEEDQFDDHLKLTDLEGWDSMAHMFFITKLESEYGIELSGDEIADMQTIGDIKEVLKRKNKLEE